MAAQVHDCSRSDLASSVNRGPPDCNRESMDDDLIAAVAAGDDSALRELFSRHAPWLAARLRSVLAAADVEGVLQETFLAVWRRAGSYLPQGMAARLLCGSPVRQAGVFP